MIDSHSDALVFYGVTGDLAFNKIFPALQAMVKRGQLNVQGGFALLGNSCEFNSFVQDCGQGQNFPV